MCMCYGCALCTTKRHWRLLCVCTYTYIYPTNVHTERNVLKNVGCCGSNSNGTLFTPTASHGRENQTLNKLKSSSKLCQTPLPLSEEEKELFFCTGSHGKHLQHDPRFKLMRAKHWKHTHVNTRKPTSCHNIQDLTFSLGAEANQSSHECVYMAACAVSEGGNIHVHAQNMYY